MIRINGVEQPVSSEQIIFEDFVSDLNKTLNAEQLVISSILVNGREISESDESALKRLPVGDLGDIDVFTAKPQDLAYETLNTLEQYIDRMVISIERAATHYKAKNLITGDAYFAKSIEGLDLFVQTIGGVKLALRIGLNPKIGLTEATLVSIMNDLLDAKRQNNYIFLAELLEKDLVSNLKEWKDDVFPLFRNWKAN
ncbi:MAG: hypothetical protein AB1540_12200 [Bdellovibrionota bacterium]